MERINRPPVGFIVEGDGEYYCYPSLFHRIVQAQNIHIPISNAGGCGRIYRNLGNELDKLVSLNHPCEVIVTVDLVDAIQQNMFTGCSELAANLRMQRDTWLQNAISDTRMEPLPDCIKIVIQVQKFETWIISDVSSLVEAGAIKEGTIQPLDTDNTIANPAVWLKDNAKSIISFKRPKVAKSLIGKLNPEVMRENSLSFDKFYREVLSSYSNWLEQCGIA